MEILYENFFYFDWKMLVMWIIGGILIYLAIKKDMEPTLLLPIGFGAILVNLPLSGAVDQVVNGETERGALSVLFDAGIANELFPLILFIGIGAMKVFRSAVVKSQTYDFRRRGAVRHIFYSLYGVDVFSNTTTPLRSR